MRVAAVQLESVVADVGENLRRCRALADEAAAAGAEWIILPEFFTTGMAFDDRLAGAALPPDGAGMQLLVDIARRHGIVAGGSFLCRDPDGHNRNAFFLVDRDGTILGRHDKDLATMWEACYYTTGSDPGVIAGPGGVPVGAAVCWELMRTQTVHRLRDRVDLLVGGSAWWSIPEYPPKALTRKLEAANARTAAGVAPAMARALGVPVVHAAHCGSIVCGVPWVPGLPYRGHFQGGAAITDAHGGVLAWRPASAGQGIVIADVDPRQVAPTLDVTDGYWLHPRGAVASVFWTYQRAHGRRWYERHARSRPADARSLDELLGAREHQTA
ncbi:carbon-nitrogen hydrolase family protein [Paraconexibacter antarcticus]|uniref:Carbon-nitrogen hydrolase family protein n=1 Tax=Paraconexibacter antarcticus TaxID=2949664 RepID=A0ABY5DMN8_9ACTN|nr:carbon-nitrogen hydrolase family protein [Paraconexibacter antarcticus]UTI62317.1 carbon-nitrogen hydrolase family protein [Paraconexibacter antarcticus]